MIKSIPAAKTLRSLRHRDYLLYLSGQTFSMTGSWMHTVALSWLVYRLTGSPAQLGLVSFLEQMPAFLLTPVTGTLCDRLSLRRIVPLTQALLCLCALTLGTLSITGNVALWHIVVISTMVGFINAMDIPARASLLGELVENHDLPNAIALNYSVFNSARVVGPAVAGIIIALSGESWCFLLNALSFVPLIIALRRMSPRPARIAAGTARPGYLSGFAESIRYVHGHHEIRHAMLLMFVSSFLGYSFLVLMPVFAAKHLGGGARLLGYLISTVGLGAIVGSLVLASRDVGERLDRIVTTSSVAFATLTILFAGSRNLPLSLCVLVVIGFFMVNLTSSANTLIQMKTEPRIRGRVMGLYTMAFTGIAPLGSLMAGKAAVWIGAPATVAATGALFLSLSLWRARQHRRGRPLRPDIVAPTPPAEPRPQTAS